MAQTTFNVAASADDAMIACSSSTYPPGTPNNFSSQTEQIDAVIRRLDVATFIVRTAVIRWDTSSLDDAAVIVGATLRLRVNFKSDADSRSLVAEWYSYDGSISDADYASTASSTAHAGTTIASITTGQDNDFALQNLENINLSGYTGIRLHISGGEPTGHNQVDWASFDHTTLTEPRLIIDTAESEAPEVLRTVVAPLRW